MPQGSSSATGVCSREKNKLSNSVDCAADSVSSKGIMFEDDFRKVSGLIGTKDAGFEGSKSPPGRAEISGAASAISLACSSAFLSKRILLNFFGAFAASIAFLRRFPRIFGGSRDWKTFLCAILAPPRVATLPLPAVELPREDRSPRGIADGSMLDIDFLVELSLWTTDGTSGTVLGLERFSAKGLSEDDEPGRVLDVDACSKARFLDTGGTSEEDCDSVRECLEFCDVIRQLESRIRIYYQNAIKEEISKTYH
jgi:hypothetical protein